MKTTGWYFIVTLGLLSSVLTAGLHVKLSLGDDVDERARQTLRCIGRAARALFTPSNDVTFVTGNDYPYPVLLREMLKESFACRTTKVLTRFRLDPTSPSTRESSFVLIDNHVNYPQLMEHSGVDRWAEYIVVSKSAREWLAEFADRLWNLGFVKVAFIRIAQQQAGAACTLHRPIQDPSSRGFKPTLKAFDLCDEELTSNQETIRPMTVHPFSSMLHTPTNATLKFAKIMEGTQLGSSFTRSTPDGKRTSLGIDILQMFATKYNIELIRYNLPDQDTTSWTDAMKRCIAGEYDVFYARELPSPTSCCDEVEPLAWYTYQTLVFADHMKKKCSTFRSLIVPYRRYVWLCTLVLLGLCCLFAHTIGILRRQGLVRERITVFQLWSVFSGQSLHAVPRKFGLRYVLGVWILHCLNNSLMYTAMFSSALTGTDYSETLETFQDILDSGRPVCGSNKTKQFLNYSGNPVMREIYERLEPILSMKVISKILNDNYIGSCHLKYVMAHNWANRANDSLQLYIPAQTAIVSYPSYYFVKKRHPFQKDFINMVSKARESGLIEYLYHLYSTVWGESEALPKLAKKEGNPFINIWHVKIMVQILLGGHLIAGLIFLVELYIPRKLVKRLGRHV